MKANQSIFVANDMCHIVDCLTNSSEFPQTDRILTLNKNFQSFSCPNFPRKIEFICLCLLLILLFVYKTYGSRKLKSKHKFKDFPQVTWSKWQNLPLILNGWFTMTQIGKDGMKVFTNCSKLYGKTFQLPFGPLNVIATADLKIIKALLTSNDPQHLNKSGYIYKRLFVKELHDGLFVSKFSTWLPQRKCLSKGFSYKSLLSYLSLVTKHTEDLTKDLQKFIEKHDEKQLEDGNVFAKHLSTQLLRFTGDLITGFGSYSETDILEIQESIEIHKECLMYVFRHPYLFLRPFWNRHSMKRVSDKATRKMLTAMKKMVSNYKSNKGKVSQEDMKFNPLIELMHDGKWSEKEILDNFGTFVFAENEATFAGIQFCLLHLALNPNHQSNCQEEIDTIFNSKKPTSLETEDDSVSLTITDLSNLKYLERCIQESLRLCPPVPLFARRLGSSLKVSENQEIKAGKTVLVMPWVLHRDPDIYPNPDQFDPDRFLPENAIERRAAPYSYIPFSAGRRNCIGWKLSQMQLKVTLAYLLRNFEIRTKDRLEDIKLFYAVRVIPERNFNIIFRKRK